MRWIQQANCRGEATSIFFPKEDEKPQERKSERVGSSRKPPLSRPIVKSSEASNNPWVAIDSEGNMQIWQRETEESWHGVEWAVVRNGEIVHLSHHLDDTYAKYGSLLHS